MVFGRRSGEELEGAVRSSTSPNPELVHLRSPKAKIRKDDEGGQLGRRMRQIGLPNFSKDELEALVRKVVREEVSQALRFHTPLHRSTMNEAEPSVARSFQLCFDSIFPSRVFTGNKIESEGPEPLKVVLLDVNTGAIVSEGPSSSFRIECVVLQGDFKAEEQANWTDKEFNDNILREREGRRPLLIGERYITLSNGVGFIRDVSFTDNSSWVRSKRFRLGARVVQGCPDAGVQEAVSGAFEVRDRRGEPYQKHGTPSLEDAVWRLSKIAKDGPHSKRLAENGIRTVKDFLQRYYIDELSLRSILGVSNKVWESIVDHAKSCSLNNDHFSCFSAEEGFGLLFNCVLNIVGITYDGQSYQPLETLSKALKLQVDRLRRYAYQNQDQLIPADVPATDSITSSPYEPLVPSTSSSLTDMHLLEDQPQKDMDFDYTESLGSEQQIRVPSLIGDVFSGLYDNEPTWYSGLPAEPSSPDGLFALEASTWFSAGEGSGLLMASSSNSHSQIGVVSPLAKFEESGSNESQPGWSKVRAAVMLKVSVGKDDGSCGGKKGKLPCYYY